MNNAGGLYIGREGEEEEIKEEKWGIENAAEESTTVRCDVERSLEKISKLSSRLPTLLPIIGRSDGVEATASL